LQVTLIIHGLGAHLKINESCKVYSSWSVYVLTCAFCDFVYLYGLEMYLLQTNTCCKIKVCYR